MWSKVKFEIQLPESIPIYFTEKKEGREEKRTAEQQRKVCLFVCPGQGGMDGGREHKQTDRHTQTHRTVAAAAAAKRKKKMILLLFLSLIHI